MVEDRLLTDKEIVRVIQDAWGDPDACPSEKFIEPGDRAIAAAQDKKSSQATAREIFSRIEGDWMLDNMSPMPSILLDYGWYQREKQKYLQG